MVIIKLTEKTGICIELVSNSLVYILLAKFADLLLTNCGTAKKANKSRNFTKKLTTV
jgi:hypothetical protein